MQTKPDPRQALEAIQALATPIRRAGLTDVVYALTEAFEAAFERLQSLDPRHPSSTLHRESDFAGPRRYFELQGVTIIEEPNPITVYQGTRAELERLAADVRRRLGPRQDAYKVDVRVPRALYATLAASLEPGDFFATIADNGPPMGERVVADEFVLTPWDATPTRGVAITDPAFVPEYDADGVIVNDPDAPALTEEQLARMKPRRPQG